VVLQYIISVPFHHLKKQPVMEHFKHLFIGLLVSVAAIMLPQGSTGQPTTWKTVAAGGSHSLAVKSDGTAWAWGGNDYGQLGIGNTTADRTTPVQVLGPNATGYLTNVVAVAGGYFFSIALKSDGTVWAWGSNGDGQLGDGTTTNRNTSVQVRGQGGTGYLTNVIAVAAGAYHALALKSDGTVWAWGYNGDGQLGVGNTSSITPVQVRGQGGTGYLTGVVAIAAGTYHTVALKNDGTVWAWGGNDYGQLGDNTTTPHNTPVQVKGAGAVGYLEGIIAVAVGYGHNVAIKNGGTVFSWGRNDDGQLGNNTTTDRTIPVQVVGSGGKGFLTNVVSVACGYSHSAAVKSDGTVWGWGSNGDGQLSDGSTTQRNVPVAATVNTGGAVAIAAGCFSSHTILLRSGQTTLFLTGNNSDGQLGDGTTTDRSTYGSTVCGSYLGVVSGSTSFSSQVLPASSTRLCFQSACYTGVDVTPNGSSPASGITNARLWVDAAEPTTITTLYTRRHYEITPATNATTATGRVTLYALQSEFTNYNNVSTQKLPTGPTDAAGEGRLRIYKYSGTSSNGSGLPASYTGTPVVIDPADVDIVWNSTGNYWEISFDVTGFSGFFIGAVNATILPIKLSSFIVAKQGSSSALTWKVTSEENIATYTIERSTDDRSFNQVGSVSSSGNTASSRTYTFTDVLPIKGTNYYRLKMMEKDGKVSYSEIRLLNFGSSIQVALYPNPAKDKVTLTGVEAGMTIRLLDAVGKVMISQKASANTVNVPISTLLTGHYLVQVINSNGTILNTAKLVKE
jgi:alpha-tubulin suppressor-like RCC1 family protein